MTSLIDVIFILLIFFMLATRFDVWQALEVSAGKAGSARQEAQPLHIKVTAPGVYELAGTRFTPEALRVRLESALSQESGRPVFVEPGAGVDLTGMMGAADIARAAGAMRLSFVDPGAGR